MEKFVGTINGKSFDNEKDFSKAAKEAIKNNDGNLSISSYYSYSDDEPVKVEEKEVKKVEKKTNILEQKDYVIGDLKPVVNEDKTLKYIVSDELKEKLQKADNKKDVASDLEGRISYAEGQLEKNTKKIAELEGKIESLQNELFEAQGVSNDLDACKSYYKELLSILKKDDKEEEIIPGVLSYLKEIGFLK